ncbi:MAG TPA: MBL fold metallo-hydrolase, partial [Gemmatimonadaceae bacterium]|nr:MBL fold metallo-hydrolase [Gemmatimonadaceae bacterium]
MSAPQPLVESRMLGGWKIHALQAGGQKLDGGAMFGVVPKPLWERRIPADERNRIPLGMRCILIEHDSGLVLIDCGAGNKENARFIDIYGIQNQGAAGRTALEDALAQLGHRPEEISMVIDSHLHFDHGGGNTFRNEGGEIVPTFPNARYIMQRGEFDYASHTNERTAASYFPHNFAPVAAASLIDFVEGEKDVASGIRVVPTPGHVPFHQSILLESKGEKAFYLADLVPTAAHLPLPWIMGYDVEP